MTDTGTIPGNKTELMAYNEKQWQAFVESTDGLTETEWTVPVDAKGWSVKDHVMCVVSWTRAEIALLQFGTTLRESQGMSEVLWNTWDFDQWNEHVRQRWLNDSPAVVRAERDRVYQKLVEVYSGLADEDFARPATDFGFSWEEGKTLLTALTTDHGDHFEEHRGYIGIIARRDSVEKQHFSL
ncbi:MAG: DinB family protein [Thermomicrobiales bacterium]